MMPDLSPIAATHRGPLLKVQGLSTHFTTASGTVQAVDGVDFEIGHGEVVGLVGESGSGKTMVGFSILGLIDPPGRIATGKVVFEGNDLVGLPERELRGLRGRRISMVFQDPLTTLSPTMRIGRQMTNVIAAHQAMPMADARQHCRDLLGKLGIPSPDERMHAYPHQLSGGMRQRVCIAMAMLNRPSLIIADEPTTALDVTTQAQILGEVRKLREETGTSFIWVTHDLAVVSELADRLLVMYAGQIVEQGAVETILNRPLHPYTKGLLDSIPTNNPDAKRLPQIPGSAPPPGIGIEGCKFRPRCGFATDTCLDKPDLKILEGTRTVRCFHPQYDVEHPLTEAMS